MDGDLSSNPNHNDEVHVGNDIPSLGQESGHADHQLPPAPPLPLAAAQSSLNIASTASRLGFTIAEQSTKASFYLSQKLITEALALPAKLADYGFGFNGVQGENENGVIESLARKAVSGTFGVAEWCALMGIEIGKMATIGGIEVASGGVKAIQNIYGNEAIRALAFFVTLCQREWSAVLPGDPPGGLSQYSYADVLHAMLALALLQSVTPDILANRIKGKLEVADATIPNRSHGHPSLSDPDIHDVEKVDIGEDGEMITGTIEDDGLPGAPLSPREQLKRYSHLCLASYGGMGQFIFGVPTQPVVEPQEFSSPTNIDQEGLRLLSSLPKAWELWNGARDIEILEKYGSLEAGSAIPGSHDGSCRVVQSALRPGQRLHSGPKYFVITDRPTKTILLLLRGTMSLDDLATDLSCESILFRPEWDKGPNDSPLLNRHRNRDQGQSEDDDQQGYRVHGGIFEIAEHIGAPMAPMTQAIAKALRENEDFELVITGHSLGGGVASLLGLLWANPLTCCTLPNSGLPDRSVQVFTFASPCVADQELCQISKPLITSFIHSLDLISRFSLGHVRDIRSAAAWLCYSNQEKSNETLNNITARVLAYRSGRLDDNPKEKEEMKEWFISLRTTLEANMSQADLFPPGNIYWFVKDSDIGMGDGEKKLYKVLDNSVFNQIILASNLLTDHLPHIYAKAIEEI